MVRTTFEHVSSENTLTQAALSVSNDRSQWQVRLVCSTNARSGRCGRCASTFRLALRFVRRTRGPVGAVDALRPSGWRSGSFDERAVRSVRSVRFNLPVGAPVRSTNARSGPCCLTFRLALRFVRRTRGPVGALRPSGWRSGSFDERAVRSVR